MLLLGTAPIVSKSVNFQPSYVVAVIREFSTPKNAKLRTGHAKEMGSVTSTGAVVTSTEKRTSTGKSSPFQTKDSESEPRN